MIPNWSSLKFWDSPAFKTLSSNLVCDPACDYVPNANRIARPFAFFAPEDTKAVIIGTSPYPSSEIADGLAYSTWPNNKRLPSSLINIFKEYQNDLGLPLPRSGSLVRWAEEGVLLLNSCLTTEKGVPNAHVNRGWEKLTIEVLQLLSERQRCVFILWGAVAGEFRGLIDERHNLVLTAPHPGPFTARSGFFGSKPFSQCNAYLRNCGLDPIDWKLR